MTEIKPLSGKPFKTIFISDTHLGFRGCRADFLLDFLKSTECEKLYLVGDIVDFWEMKKRVHWPLEHTAVLKEILKKSRNGTKVYYVPGNHDELIREYDGSVFENIVVADQLMHETADGRKLLVLHGDQFDAVVKCSPLLAKAGSRMYDWLLLANHYYNWGRRKLGFPYWSLSAYIKHRVKNAVSYISKFEEAVAYEAKRRGADGLVCGHIHHAEIREINGVLYCNDGDWVESCTALVEQHDGSLELIYWTEQAHLVKGEDAMAGEIAAPEAA